MRRGTTPNPNLLAIRVKDLGFRVKELVLENLGFRVRECRV